MTGSRVNVKDLDDMITFAECLLPGYMHLMYTEEPGNNLWSEDYSYSFKLLTSKEEPCLLFFFSS